MVAAQDAAAVVAAQDVAAVPEPVNLRPADGRLVPGGGGEAGPLPAHRSLLMLV
ncbi:hypothetical protein Aph02nite_16370 [Actinoplanes philippinensis]|nr:hypothetical protein Aph02nite_16370 [Actinoplanes philippinensis]